MVAGQGRTGEKPARGLRHRLRDEHHRDFHQGGAKLRSAGERLGTFRDHENRKKLFAASFTVWVRYEDKAGAMRAERVFFDRTWRFVGKSSLVDGVKYRKKDGNMRPKSWAMFDAGQANWSSEVEFEAAVKRSETFRANELVKEHLSDLSEDDQKLCTSGCTRSLRHEHNQAFPIPKRWPASRWLEQLRSFCAAEQRRPRKSCAALRRSTQKSLHFRTGTDIAWDWF
jgi:hypothetical protein